MAPSSLERPEGEYITSFYLVMLFLGRQEKKRNEYLSVPWCVPRGDPGRGHELWVGNWVLWWRDRVVPPRRQNGKFVFSC